jgi:methionyl-tRNA synthetase
MHLVNGHCRPMWSSHGSCGVRNIARSAVNLAIHRHVARPPSVSRSLHKTTYALQAANDNNAADNYFTVTTPLYYVNASPHMGSAYPTIAADVLARYHRLAGKDVHFLTGTDEHGEKIALAAQKKGMQPKEHCDAVVEAYKQLWQQLDISYDAFVRTTDPKHENLVKTVLNRVWEKGDIYAADYEGLYCVDCEEYKDTADLTGPDNLCPVHQKPCLSRKEKNYFFALSKYQNEVQSLIENSYTKNHGTVEFVSPESRKNEVLGWVKEGLRDFSISRAAVSWGIPVPKDPEQTVYVWFDALLGYVSGLLPPPSSPNEQLQPEDALSKGWPASVHIIGKDILRFHAVYWPAMLLSAGLPPPQRVFGHGFLTKDGMKMGKSLGNVLDPVALVETYGSDAVRFFFMQEVPFGGDGDFSEQRFRDIVNAELANNVGNLLNRTANLLKKNCGGVLPRHPSVDHPLKTTAAAAVAGAEVGYNTMKFHDAIAAALSISSRGNRYLEETAPWTAFKSGSDADKAAAGAALVDVLEAVRIVAVLLSPVTPALSKKVYLQLGYNEEEFQGLSWGGSVEWGGLKEGHVVPKPSPIFVRLETEEWVTK